MELTTRGRALADPVKTILTQIRELNDQGKSFDPSQAQRVFRISATAYVSELLAVPLIARLQQQAPMVSVQFEELSVNTVDRILNGQLDFAITISARILDKIDEHSPLLRSRKLFTDQFVVALAKSHPYSKETISFDQLCEMGYIETRFDSSIIGVSELLWRQQPKQPQTRGWLPNFHLTLDTVGQTDMAAILPSLLVRLRGQRYGVRSLPVPFQMPLLEETLYSHKRNESDAGHRWMADTLEKVVEELDL